MSWIAALILFLVMLGLVLVGAATLALDLFVLLIFAVLLVGFGIWVLGGLSRGN